MSVASASTSGSAPPSCNLRGRTQVGWLQVQRGKVEVRSCHASLRIRMRDLNVHKRMLFLGVPKQNLAPNLHPTKSG
eukprot:808075-Rhodomonas_salina.2